jgi:hypothetical protein
MQRCGQERSRTSEVEDSGFTVRPIWPLWNLPEKKHDRASGGIRTPDQLITNQLLWPTELHWLLISYAEVSGKGPTTSFMFHFSENQYHKEHSQTTPLIPLIFGKAKVTEFVKSENLKAEIF